MTGVAEKIWELKDNNIQHEIKWQILKQVPKYTNISKKCELCLHEKTMILFADKKVSLNKKNEIMQKCRHKEDWLLGHQPKKKKKLG